MSLRFMFITQINHIVFPHGFVCFEYTSIIAWVNHWSRIYVPPFVCINHKYLTNYNNLIIIGFISFITLKFFPVLAFSLIVTQFFTSIVENIIFILSNELGFLVLVPKSGFELQFLFNQVYLSTKIFHFIFLISRVSFLLDSKMFKLF